MSDITIRNHGSIVLLVPNTPDAVAWVEENIGEDNGFQPQWPTVLVEPRFVGDIVDGMLNDGLTVG